MLFEPYVRFHIFSSVRVTEWPPSASALYSVGLVTALYTGGESGVV